MPRKNNDLSSMLCRSLCFYSCWYVALGISDYPMPETATGFLRNQAWDSMMIAFRPKDPGKTVAGPEIFTISERAKILLLLEILVNWNIFLSPVIISKKRLPFLCFSRCKLDLATFSKIVNWFSVSAIWLWKQSTLPEPWGSEVLRVNFVQHESPSLFFFSFLPHSSATLTAFQFWSCFSNALRFLSQICQKFPLGEFTVILGTFL